MGEDRLEEFMKNKVFDHQTPADVDAIWQGIQAKQEAGEEPKRKRFLWFCLLLGVLLITAGIAYCIQDDAKKEKANQEQQTAEILTNSKLDSSGVKNEVSLAENLLTTISITDKNQSVSDDGQSVNKTTRNAKTKEVSQTAIVPLTQSTNILNNSTSAAGFRVPLNPSEPTTLTSDAKAEGISETIVERTVTNAEIPTINEQVSPATVRSSVIELALLELIDPSPQSKTSYDPTKSFDVVSTQNNSPYSIGLYFDGGLSSRKLRAKQEEGEDYIQRRNELETPQQVLSGGFDVQYQFKSGLFVKSGIVYEQITERFDLNKITPPENFFNENAISAIYYLSDGSTSTQFGTISTTQLLQIRKIFNRYRMLDLPLLVGYNSKLQGRFSWFAEGGISFNLTFIPGGEVLANDGEETIIDLSETDILKNNTGISLNTGLGLSLRFNKDCSLWLSPRFRYALSSMTADHYPLEQSFIRGTLQLGIRKGL